MFLSAALDCFGLMPNQELGVKVFSGLGRVSLGKLALGRVSLGKLAQVFVCATCE